MQIKPGPTCIPGKPPASFLSRPCTPESQRLAGAAASASAFTSTIYFTPKKRPSCKMERKHLETGEKFMALRGGCLTPQTLWK